MAGTGADEISDQSDMVETSLASRENRSFSDVGSPEKGKRIAKHKCPGRRASSWAKARACWVKHFHA